MKRRMISTIMLLAMAVSTAGLYGCDQGKSDNSMTIALLAFANRGLTVSHVTPADNSTLVALNANIEVKFNKATDGITFGTVSLDIGSGGTLALTDGDNCSMSFNTDNNILTIDPDDNFIADTLYQNITVSGFKDEDGTVMDDYNDPAYNFTTDIGLTVSQIVPATDSTLIPLATLFYITFNKATDGATFGTVTINYGSSGTLSLTKGVNCAMVFNTEHTILTVEPDDLLLSNRLYHHITVSGFKDVYGSLMSPYDDSTYNFTTEVVTVSTINPPRPLTGATSVLTSSQIIIYFTDSLNTAQFGTVTLAAGVPDVTFTNGVNCVITFPGTGDYAVITPSAPLSSATVYSNLRVSGFQASDGGAIPDYSDATYHFTTL
jgi:hypothetical protein